MANIVINEISQNYTYNIGASTFATVALPITACWGDGYFNPDSVGMTKEEALEKATWKEFQANQAGLEAFVAEYRGATSCYRTCKDYSYQMAVSLLTSGYNVLVCRISNGSQAQVEATTKDGKTFTIKAKYAGSFGNNLNVVIKNMKWGNISYQNVVVYVKDTSGSKSAVENFNFVFNQNTADENDNYTFVEDVDSKFIIFENTESITSDEGLEFEDYYTLGGGADAVTYDESTGVPSVETVLDADEGSVETPIWTTNTKYNKTTEYTYTKEGESKTSESYTIVQANEKLVGAFTASTKYDAGDIVTSGSDYKVSLVTYTATALDDTVWSAISEAYSESTTYAEGAIVFDNGHFYVSLQNDNTNKSLTDDQWWQAMTDVALWKVNTDYAVDDKAAYNDVLYNCTKVHKSGTEFNVNAWNAITEEDVEALCKNFIYLGTTETTSSATFKDDYKNGLWSETTSAWVTINTILPLIKDRYGATDGLYYEAVLKSCPKKSASQIANIAYMEWNYTTVCGTTDSSTNVYDNGVYGTLQDKLAYAPDVIISPCWDDQNISAITGEEFKEDEGVGYLRDISPIHRVLMDTAFYSRCACAFLDIPKTISRSAVYTSETTPDGREGYAQLLTTRTKETVEDTKIYSTCSTLFAPWGQYRYVGSSKQNMASPSFLALIIMRSMSLNDTIQYFWKLPSNRRNNAKIGKLDYVVTKKYLDMWQGDSGVGVNVITDIPSIGTTVWGNSTLYDVPPATYNALQNLSTRLLIDELRDISYRVGISITYNYNNQEAYSNFYAGVTPTLDAMMNVGAITDYRVTMSADLNGEEQVNANSVIGKIYVAVTGVINDITIDLIALPQNTDLSQFRQ